MWDRYETIRDDAERVSKFVFYKANAVSEAVLYRYPDYKTRTVICCSTMSGCPMGCRFCGSGDYFVRSLNAEEIVEQVDTCLVNTDCKPEDMGRLQIMFMSMGEPLLNLKGLLPALDILHSKYPNAALLISTSGPDVDFEPFFESAARIEKVGLQFSVHESSNEARDKLVPFKKKLTLEGMAEQGLKFYQATGRKPFFNYCAHDLNSRDADADVLASMYDPSVWCATVSVICERDEGLPKTNEHQRNLASNFASKLVERGFDVRVFDPAGQDTIGGGCGQLHYVQSWFKENPDLAKKSVGNGLPIVHTPG